MVRILRADRVLTSRLEFLSSNIFGADRLATLADGMILDTGSAATSLKPFFRNYGPDLAGLFLGDTGALRIETMVTLRLMRRPTDIGFPSFNFDEPEKMLRALIASANAGVATENLASRNPLIYQAV